MTKREHLNKLSSGILLLAGIAALTVIFVSSFQAVKTLGQQYRVFTEADLSKPFREVLSFDDNVYISLGSGIEILPDDPGKEAALASFISSALYSIDRRICSTGVFYTMIIGTLLSFFLYRISGGEKKKHILWIVLTVFGIYVLYIGGLFLFHKLNSVPFCFPKGKDLMVTMTGILSVAGGLCAAGFLIRKVPYRKTVSLILIPVVFALYLFGTPLQNGLYTEKTVKSFAYVGDIDPRIYEEGFNDYVYDPEKDVVILDGKEYPPEELPNPDYLTGLSRAGAILYEIADPFAGNSLPFVNEILETPLPMVVLIGHILKGILWIVLPLFGKPE